MTLLAAILVAAAPAPAAPPPAPYFARIDGCSHGHHAPVAKRALTRELRNHRPLGVFRMATVAHLRRCTYTRQERLRVNTHRIRLRAWRARYAHRWPIRFNAMSPYDRAWAVSTGACESGNNPRAATGNGFYGAHQWLPSTWYAADQTGMFVTATSWHHQAVVAVRWRNIAGAGQWPNCG